MERLVGPNAVNTLTNNAIYSVESEKFLFFYNDLTAAHWVLTIESDLSDQLLVDRFLKIHHIFLGRLGRQEKGMFSKVPVTKLAKVVRGWMSLYRCTMSLLGDQYPRSSMSRDLVIGEVNWSERLNVSASGLLLIDHSSRYAEYWAERSIKTKDGYSSLEYRLSFVGGNAYNGYAQMVRRGELLVLDSFSNGVTSYDMMIFVRESGCSANSFLAEIHKIGWRLELGGKEAIDYIFQIYEKLEDGDLHI